MEIKIIEEFNKLENNPTLVCEELKNLITGKEIKLYELDEDSKVYSYVNDYKIESVFMWDEDQIAFTSAHFAEFILLCEKSEKLWGKTFSYTLINFNNL